MIPRVAARPASGASGASASTAAVACRRTPRVVVHTELPLPCHPTRVVVEFTLDLLVPEAADGRMNDRERAVARSVLRSFLAAPSECVTACVLDRAALLRALDDPGLGVRLRVDGTDL